MIKIEDILINTDTITMLEVLKDELALHGINRFFQFRLNGQNIQTTCPFHKDGQERKPSFGVNGELNKCHCFACGWSGGIEDMISQLYGYQDRGKYGKNWLIKHFNSVEIETRPNLMEVLNGSSNNNSNIANNKHSGKYIPESLLDSYRYIHPYMYKRGLTDEIIEEFDIGYDKSRSCLTFPILDLDGNCVFVATRNVSNKFFTLPKDLEKPIYQAYRFTNGKYKEAWIVESFLNCLTLWKYGIPSMALIGTGNKHQYDILSKLPVRSYVLAFDPDNAGYKATQRFRRNVKNKLIKEVVYKDDRDINDLQEEVKSLEVVF
jgi:DNA primase